MSKEEIFWTEFETFDHCPLWWAWSYYTPKEEKSYTLVKDTQHLARGNATQGLVDRWVTEGWWKLPDSAERSLWEDYLPKSVDLALEEGRRTGDPKIQKMDLWLEVRNNLGRILPKLKELFRTLGGDDFSGVTVQSQVKLAGRHKSGIILSAIADTVINWGTRVILIEGKSTRSPHKSTNYQLRWQLDCANLQGLNTFRSHYYAFYHTGQLWEVKKDDPEQSLWEALREKCIARILDVLS